MSFITKSISIFLAITAVMGAPLSLQASNSVTTRCLDPSNTGMGCKRAIEHEVKAVLNQGCLCSLNSTHVNMGCKRGEPVPVLNERCLRSLNSTHVDMGCNVDAEMEEIEARKSEPEAEPIYERKSLFLGVESGNDTGMGC